MDFEIVYVVWAVLLILINLAAWFATLFSLPGNWVMLISTGLFAFCYPAGGIGERGISWTLVAVLAGLAVLGEVIEFSAGAAGAAKLGCSRRGMVLAVLGTVVGSIIGVMIGVPVPLVGSILGALGGGALGAFLGAYLGEIWKGRTSDEGLAVGKAALLGRLLGTAAKLIVGAIMVVLSTTAAFF